MLKLHLNLIWPFLLSVGMAWSDLKTERIPNYLTLGGALAGLGYQLGMHGWTGLADGFLGMVLGFALLIFFYVKGGMGAGDVKALAALGAWLGPWQTLHLFIFMGLSGLLVIVVILWWRGLLREKIRRAGGSLMSWVLLRPHAQQLPQSANSSPPKMETIPYAVTFPMGMALLACWRIFGS